MMNVSSDCTTKTIAVVLAKTARWGPITSSFISRAFSTETTGSFENTE